MMLSLASWIALVIYLWKTGPEKIFWIGMTYLTVITAELLIFRHRGNHEQNPGIHGKY